MLSKLSSQIISIEVTDWPLNEVIYKLVNDYGIQVSFDDDLLGSFKVSLNQTFPSPDDVFNEMLSGFPLQYEKRNDVYIIYRQKKKQTEKEYILTGRILDSKSNESLPYSHIIINNHGLISGFNGSFSFVSSSDSLFNVKVLYLGYYVKDTMLNWGTNQVIMLTPSFIGLKEVVIEGEVIERSSQIGEKAGVIRLNHKIATRLPGNGDNSVFNFLRLQPGILAAGEQSSNLIIWGGYEGHSQVLFDGFTIFGLKNFNDNISAVNPYLAKDIVVMKGGYGADYGDRVGGVVNISGIEGNTMAPSFNFNINNMTINGMVSLPVKKQSSLIFAFRRTYYNLYDPEDVNLFNPRNSNLTDINVYPDYTFRDMNLKYAGSSKNGDTYFISLFQGRDDFSYRIDEDRNVVSVFQESTEQNNQYGGTLYWGKLWKSANSSNISLSYSGLQKDLYNTQLIKRLSNDVLISQRDEFIHNEIGEITIKSKNEFVINQTHRLETGIGYVYDAIRFREDSLEHTISVTSRNAHRLNGFLQDKIYIYNRLQIKPGIRLDYPLNLNKLYLQPRISVSAQLDDFWKLNAAWGVYNQFISETSVLDDLGNYQYFWAICDNIDVPVLQSMHYVAGLSYKKNQITLSIEGFYKTTDGITRYIYFPRENFRTVFQGDSKAYGLDLFIKGRYHKHEAWVSYTLSKTEEYFPYFFLPEYRDAPHDQRHEVKTALLLNFDPFFFSANYVYGSGFRNQYRFLNVPDEERYPYRRLDAAFIYRYGFKEFHIEAGISILNVLNAENIKIANFIKVPSSQTNTINIHAEAVPFTPMIFLNLSF